MAYRKSPGVSINEIDNTLITAGLNSRVAAHVGLFNWGPTNYPTTVTNEQDLVAQFGKPSTQSAQSFYTAANFLAYSNNLLNVRIDANGQYNAVPNHKITLAGTISVSGTAVTGTATSFDTELVVGDVIIITPVNATEYVTVGTVETITSATALVLSTAYTGATIADATASIDKRIVIKNEDHYISNFEGGAADVGQFAAKYSGKLGNSLQVIVLDSSNFEHFSYAGSTITTTTSSKTVTLAGVTSADYFQPGFVLEKADGLGGYTTIGVVKRVISNTSLELAAVPTQTLTGSTFTVSTPSEYRSLFTSAPGTSQFATDNGYETAKDEVHVIVVDKDGMFTGTKNAVLERWGFLSKMSDALGDNSSTIYYKSIINKESKYIWWLDQPDAAILGSTGIEWGTALRQVADVTSSVKALKYPNFVSLAGGFDASPYATTDAKNADKILSLQILQNKELYTFNAIAVGQATTTVANAAIAVCEMRKDAVAFISPEHTDGTPIEGTGTAAVNKILVYRDALPSTSYAFLDSGYKQQLDRYNDRIIKVPLNGDIAGLNAIATQDQPWQSPAGFNNGQLRNTSKLLFNSTEQDRDILYPKGVNCVVSFKAQGTILYGDKTLLSKPSAFDRIGVRNLFIFLEQTIEQTAKYTLFGINDPFTRSQFKNAVEPFLRDIKGNRGIFDYLIVCDETNNTSNIVETNHFVADIKIKPQYSISFITLNFTGTRQSASFTTTV